MSVNFIFSVYYDLFVLTNTLHDVFDYYHEPFGVAGALALKQRGPPAHSHLSFLSNISAFIAVSLYVFDLGAESQISVWVERGTIDFPPESADVPVIMVGPGTGCAPFRSFIHDRTSRETSGQSDLLVVCVFFFQIMICELDLELGEQWNQLCDGGTGWQCVRCQNSGHALIKLQTFTREERC